MSKTVFEHVWGELTDSTGKTYNMQLDLTVKELEVDEIVMPVGRALARVALSPMSGLVLPDGNYTLTYPFDGKQQKDKVRVVSGTLLSA